MFWFSGLQDHLGVIVAALILDIFLGDPVYSFHPIRIIGFAVKQGEVIFRRVFPRRPFFAGALLTAIIVVGTGMAVFLLLRAADTFSQYFGMALEVVFLYTAFSLGALVKEGRTIGEFLEHGRVGEARTSLSFLVSRDVSGENARGVIRGILETLAENLSDGIIAPVFYALIGGASLAFVYKAVNTLDSMIGYKNERYFWFGKCAARLDDAANYLPARLTGVLIIMTSLFFREHPLKGVRAWYRDAQQGPSPNGGIPIVTFAGAHDIVLGGDCITPDGSVIHIPEVGGSRRKLVPADIRSAILYIYVAVFLFIVICILGLKFF